MRQSQSFQEAITRADSARDAGDWMAGEVAYRAALQIDPSRAGYRVQLAHCLKEQGRFVEAEIEYRCAMAVGASSDDVLEHLEFVTLQNGRKKSEKSFDVSNVETSGLGADPVETIEFWNYVLTGTRAVDKDRLLQYVREGWSIQSIIAETIMTLDFARANRSFLVVFNRQKTSGR